MADFAALFLHQAEASAQVQFAYEVATGQVVFVNAAYEQVFNGHRALVNEELPGLLARLHPDDYTFLTQYWKLWVRNQACDEVEVRLLRPGQPDQWLCLTPYCHFTESGAPVLTGTLRDISTSKHYQLNSDRFNARKNATLEILSHDLSGAFAMVQQIGQYLQGEVRVPTGSRVPELLQVLETTSHKSMQMIREFVHLEFLLSANTDLKRDRVEVSTVLREPLDQLQQQHDLLSQHFSYSLPTEPVYVNLDVNKFLQVINNLVSNALKFTPDGGRIAVEVTPTATGVRIQVQDSGIGIPLELQPHLFERFTKARRVGLRGEPTTGLGLVLCQTIVEWHHGTLALASTEGQGTTVTIDLPHAAA